MPWMVAVAGWNSREVLDESLSRFNCYFPKFREKIVVRGRRVWRDQDLFGRYFFVAVSEIWRELFQARGIHDVLGSDGQPSLVSDKIIDSIKAREVNGYVDVRRPKFKRGQRVQVMTGYFAGSVGEFHGMGRRDREVALLNLLGRPTRIEVAAGSLAPL